MSYLENLFSLSDKSVFLTGASSGIGERWAETVCKAGCKRLALCARRTDRLKVLADELCQKYPNAKVCVVTLDVNEDETKIKLAFDEAEKRFEPHATFDVIINNAGVGPNSPVLQATQETFNSTYVFV